MSEEIKLKSGEIGRFCADSNFTVEVIDGEAIIKPLSSCFIHYNPKDDKKYTHDCNQCVYLGLGCMDSKEYDLYFCKQGGIMPTVIARFGDNTPDYLSGLGADGILREAECLAKKWGLL